MALPILGFFLASGISFIAGCQPSKPEPVAAKPYRPPGIVAEIDNENFRQVTADGRTVFIDFWAPWCGPCKEMEPVVQELANELGGEMTFGKINIDEQQYLKKRYEIEYIPLFIVFKDGEEVERFEGIQDKEVLSQAIRKHLPVDEPKASASASTDSASESDATHAD